MPWVASPWSPRDSPWSEVSTIKGASAAPSATDGLSSASASTSTIIALDWAANRGQTFVVEYSVDLVQWSQLSASVEEVAEGQYEARLYAPAESPCFFRVRQVDARLVAPMQRSER